MVKCGPKPRKLTARQLRNLVREEKRILSLQHQAAQVPSSPRKKKVWVRPSQFDVSLARKKRVKNYPRQIVPKKARSEASIAFSAITEEIPLFEELKRTHRLVYVHVPQRPVPLVWPQTPTRETPHVNTIASISGPATPIAKCEYRGIFSGLAPNLSTGPENHQPCLLSTPIASSTPLGTPCCTVQEQVLSPVYIENKLQNILALNEGVFHDEATIVTSSPKPVLSAVTTQSGALCVSTSEGGPLVSEARKFSAPSWSTYGEPNVSTGRFLDFDPALKEDSSQPQGSDSISPDNSKQCNKQIVLPTIRPLVIQRRAQSLQASHILSQLPLEPDPDPTSFPRVQLPRTVPGPPVSVNQSMRQDSPETVYHRSLMTSLRTESIEYPTVNDQPRLKSSFLAPHQDDHDNPRLVPKPAQTTSVVSVFSCQNKDPILATEKTSPVEHSPCCLGDQRYSSSKAVQLDSHVVQSTKPTLNAYIGDSTPGGAKSKRRIFGIYRRRNVLSIDGTAGAFANAILRQTGHLRQKDGDTPMVLNTSFRQGITALKPIDDTGIQDRHVPSRFQGQPTSFNNMGYYLSSDDTLQSRAASTPSRLDMDTPKVPLAPAAVIRNDPFKPPFMRPHRKRFFPTSRIPAYRMGSPYATLEPHKTSSAREALSPQTVHMEPMVDEEVTDSQVLESRVDTGSAQWKGHLDGICHHVATDIGASNAPMQGRDDQHPEHALPVQIVHSQSQMSLAVLPPSESEQTKEKRGSSKKVFMALKAVYNKLWA